MKRTKLLAFMIIAVFSFSNVLSFATTITDLKNKQTDIQSQSKKAQDLLNETKTQKSQVLEEVLKLDAQLDVAEAELERITTDLDKTTLRLDEAKVELSIAEDKKEKQHEALKERVRFMYENGSIGYLDVVFDSKDFADFVNRVEYVNQIVEYDNNLVNQLAHTEQTIADRIDEIDAKKKEIEIIAENQKTVKASLEQDINLRNQRVQALSEDEKSYGQQIKDLENSSNEIEKLIKEAQAKAEAEAKAKAEAEARAKAAADAAKKAAQSQAPKSTSTSSYTGGKFSWPVRGTITSGYVNRTNPISGKKEFHTGIDIAVSTGTNVAAAASGTVIASKYMSGYGYTVIIDHGGGLSTLYGHNSKLIANVGETVSKGQTVAKSGSTGYSTGPHVHFEVRVNGSHVPPLPYLQ